MQNALFYISAVLMVYFAFRAVTSPFLFRAALYLAGTLALTAVQYLLMQAAFLAVLQLLVYVGAVIILIIFAVMLTSQLGDGHQAQWNALALPSALLVVALGLGLWKGVAHHAWSAVTAASALTPRSAAPMSNIQVIGISLMGDYALPLEITGLLLFTALVGAVLIARKEPGQ